MANRLDTVGLSYLWSKLKAYFASKTQLANDLNGKADAIITNSDPKASFSPGDIITYGDVYRIIVDREEGFAGIAYADAESVIPPADRTESGIFTFTGPNSVHIAGEPSADATLNITVYDETAFQPETEISEDDVLHFGVYLTGTITGSGDPIEITLTLTPEEGTADVHTFTIANSLGLQQFSFTAGCDAESISMSITAAAGFEYDAYLSWGAVIGEEYTAQTFGTDTEMAFGSSDIAAAGISFLGLPGYAEYTADTKTYVDEHSSDYPNATEETAGLMSAADKTKLNGIAAGATANAGTITGIMMNGASKGTSGVVNLGTVLTELTKSMVTTALGYTPPETDHQYSAGTGLLLSSGAFSVKLGYSAGGKNYAVQADENGNLYVNVPWTDHYAWSDITGKPTIPTKTSQLTNDSGFLTSHQDISGKVSGPSSATNNAVAIFDGTTGKVIKDSGLTIGKSVPSDAVFTDHTYSFTDANPTLVWGTKSKVATVGGVDIHVTMPANPNSNTTYTIATGDSNGQIKVTPSSGNAYNVSVKGLGSAAYTDSSAYAASSHSHSNYLTGITKAMVTNALGYTPPTTNTTYTGGSGISISGTTISINDTYGIVSGFSFQDTSTQLASHGIINIPNPKDAYIEWGGRNMVASFSPIDAGLNGNFRANRFAGMAASKITVEYSRNGGSSWTDYGATDLQKRSLFTTSTSLGIGKNDSTYKATANGENYQLRITIDTSSNVYTTLNKFLILVSTNGSSDCRVKIQKALQSTPTTFVDHTGWEVISGWSGWNTINISSLTTYGNTAASQYGRIRFIFKANGGNTTYTGLGVLAIYGYGGVGWTTPSTLALKDHVYDYDGTLAVTFPNRVTAPSFYLNSQDMGKAVKSISRSGTTFTATCCDGTTFTFTQQDTNSGGTITGIKMNGASKGTSGVVDLGTVITAHQSIAGKVNIGTGGTVDYPVLTGVNIRNDSAGDDTIPMLDTSGNAVGGILFNKSNRHFTFKQYNTARSYYERYLLPVSTSCTANTDYNIITNKDFALSRVDCTKNSTYISSFSVKVIRYSAHILVLSGQMNIGSTQVPDSTTVFTTPAGYRPGYQFTILAHTLNGSGKVPVVLYWNTDGTVKTGASGGNRYLYATEWYSFNAVALA